MVKHNILFGGKAGQGPNILSDLVAKGLLHNGYYVFYERDYQSLIRGGHNFNTLSFSDKPIMSNFKGIDIIVALDENTKEIHSNELEKNPIILDGGHPNMYFAGSLFKILGIEFEVLEKELKQLSRFDENIKEAKQGYESETKSLGIGKLPSRELSFMNGNQAIAKGAIASGLEFYYAYPMTPATGVLTELAQAQKAVNNTHITIELENEIAIINSAIGSALTGAKAMVGTSGGGFDLMTEALSLTGIAEIPLVLYLSQRPGPATGVATYTGQGDLNMARHSGHGEFSRLLVAPGDPKEALSLTSEAFYFSQKYRIPAIIIGDKHLAESKYSFEGKPKLQPSEKSITKLERFNSYEKDKQGSATDVPAQIIKNIDKRLKKHQQIQNETQGFETSKTYGNKDSKNLVVSWGSTKGAILDAIQNPDIDCKFLQILYLEPFSETAKQELSKAENIIVIENNATSPLSALISEKTERIILDDHKILKYDARPFTSTEIESKLRKILK
jgi:2-oxoglutarate ferredoxin oxidoreductase subunit alpha